MRIPIRYQFMLPFFAVAIASLVAIGIVSSLVFSQQVKLRIERQLQGVVGVLAKNSFPLNDSVLRKMGGLARARFVLADADGRTIATGGSIKIDVPPADEQTARHPGEVALGAEVSAGEQTYFQSSIWVGPQRRETEPRVLHIYFATEEFDAVWRSAFLPPLLVGIAMVAAVALVTHLAAHRLSNVLARLGSDVQRLAEGDFGSIDRPDWNDETDDLATAINQTATRLQQYESQLLRDERARTVAMLGAGLAHEMRNAATGCRLAIDLHAEQFLGDPTGDESLQVARQQLVVMESKLKQLLHLGRPSPEGNNRHVDMTEVVSEAAALVTPAARHAGVRIEWDPPTGNLDVDADPDLLQQAILNVILNALESAAKSQAATPTAGFVRIELTAEHEQVQLTVSDSGQGPCDAVQQSLFEPFVSGKPEGVGLGLAVTKRVVDSYDGKIDWHHHNGLTQFTIHLPRALVGAINA